jgi:hypothetical protein
MSQESPVTMNATKLALFCIVIFGILLVLGIAVSIRFYTMDMHLIMYKVQPMSGKFQEWPYKNEYGVLTLWF